jgi:tetratricopeptide (TPR) repeat protein
MATVGPARPVRAPGNTIATMPLDPSSGALDVILGLAALATLIGLIRSWRPFWDDDFTVADRKTATQVAVFLVPPVVVLLHELGHLYAARALGVRVIGFSYGLFEGSVTVAGRRTPLDNWLIAVAGNLVTAVVALAMIATAVYGVRLRRPLRYVLLAGGLLELVFTLILYPVMSFMAQFGDWIVIYDSDRTPNLSLASAVVHAAALYMLWRWWRRRGREKLFAIGAGSEGEVAELRKVIEASPSDPAGWLTLADYYARRGELALARTTVEQGLDAAGESPRLLLGLTRLSMFQGRWNDAVLAARRGLQAAGDDSTGDDSTGPEDVRQPLWANLALALTQMERADHALPAYEHLTSPLADDVRVRYGRGVVELTAGDADRGRADLEAVVRSLPEDNLLRKWAEARLEGRPLKDWADPRVPAYQRGSAPPPAPLAGL